MDYYTGGVFEKKDLSLAEEKGRKMALLGHDVYIKRSFQGGTVKYVLKISFKKKPGRIPKKPKIEIVG